MPSAASYTNKLRVAAQLRSRKVQLPGGMADATQSLRSACNLSMSYTPVSYKIPCPCNKFPPPSPVPCAGDQLVYYSDGASNFDVTPCTTLDGGDDTLENGVVYDGGVDCI